MAAKYNNYYEKFDSVPAFVDTISKREFNPVFPDYLRCSVSGSQSFTSTKDYTEASDLFKSGDIENMNKISGARDKKLDGANNYTNRNKIVLGVAGGVPCVPHYIIGVPNNMMTVKKTPIKAKVVTLLVNTTVPCCVESSDIIKYGSYIASAINSIELSGVRIELYMGSYLSTRDRKNDFSAIIKLKNSSAPFNKLAFAYPIINPSFFRRHIFRFIETIPVKVSDTLAHGYGVIKMYKKDSDPIKEAFARVPALAVLNLYKCIDKRLTLEDIKKAIINNECV